MKNSEKTMDQIVALCKGRGFVYPGSEIYGGLANSWDYGPLGVELKNNVKRAWWKTVSYTHLVKGVHAYPVARQGFKGVGADKLRGVSGHEYLDVRPLLHQGRGQARRLIACNAAGDTQQHSFSL